MKGQHLRERRFRKIGTNCRNGGAGEIESSDWADGFIVNENESEPEIYRRIWILNLILQSDTGLQFLGLFWGCLRPFVKISKL